MLDFVDYEPENKEVAICNNCSRPINRDENYYAFSKEETICEDCLDEFVEQYIIYGED